MPPKNQDLTITAILHHFCCTAQNAGECVDESNMKNINEFHGGGLKKICCSFLPVKMYNENLHTKKSFHVVLEIKHWLLQHPQNGVAL